MAMLKNQRVYKLFAPLVSRSADCLRWYKISQAVRMMVKHQGPQKSLLSVGSTVEHLGWLSLCLKLLWKAVISDVIVGCCCFFWCLAATWNLRLWHSLTTWTILDRHAEGKSKRKDEHGGSSRASERFYLWRGTFNWSCSELVKVILWMWNLYVRWWPPNTQNIYWFINPMNTIDISPINHSYWS